MALELRRGSERIIKELDKFGIRAGIEPLDNICHYGYSSSSSLINKAKVSSELSVPGNPIHRLAQFPSSLPRMNILESLDRHSVIVEPLISNFERRTSNFEPQTSLSSSRTLFLKLDLSVNINLFRVVVHFSG